MFFYRFFRPAFVQETFPISTTKLTNFYLATNPVNIYIDGRHICIYAYPYTSKLKKNIIYDETENEKEYGIAVAKLLTTNAHLTAGINKSFCSSLSIWHSPDMLILADKSTKHQFDCKIFNNLSFLKLPSFSKNNFQFKVIYTDSNTAEHSQIFM